MRAVGIDGRSLAKKKHVGYIDEQELNRVRVNHLQPIPSQCRVHEVDYGFMKTHTF